MRFGVCCRPSSAGGRSPLNLRSPLRHSTSSQRRRSHRAETTRPAVLKIIGNHISPFVRKGLAVCEIKGLPYEIDSIVPFFGNERFGELSPLRRIPILVDGTIVINDSSVICEYLQEKWPKLPVLPEDPAARAQARFLDEFADTRLADVVLWKVF